MRNDDDDQKNSNNTHLLPALVGARTSAGPRLSPIIGEERRGEERHMVIAQDSRRQCTEKTSTVVNLSAQGWRPIASSSFAVAVVVAQFVADVAAAVLLLPRGCSICFPFSFDLRQNIQLTTFRHGTRAVWNRCCSLSLSHKNNMKTSRATQYETRRVNERKPQERKVKQSKQERQHKLYLYCIVLYMKSVSVHQKVPKRQANITSCC